MVFNSGKNNQTVNPDIQEVSSDDTILSCPEGNGINILGVRVAGRPDFNNLDESKMEPCLIDDALKELNAL